MIGFLLPAYFTIFTSDPVLGGGGPKLKIPISWSIDVDVDVDVAVAVGVAYRRVVREMDDALVGKQVVCARTKRSLKTDEEGSGRGGIVDVVPPSLSLQVRSVWRIVWVYGVSVGEGRWEGESECHVKRGDWMSERITYTTHNPISILLAFL